MRNLKFDIQMKLNLFDRFILKGFPRLIYLSIALDPLTDRIFGEARLWYVVSFVAFIIMCVWEYLRGKKLKAQYGEKEFDKVVRNYDTEYKYDVVISLIGFAVCYVTHDGAWWLLLAILLFSTVLKFSAALKRWALRKL